MDDAGANPVQSSVHAQKSGRMLPIAIVVALVLLLGSGAVAAFAVPVVSLDSSRSPASMLPASTAFYLSVDLNPSSATRDNWTRIVHTFTDQPGWRSISQAYSQGTKSSPNTSDCYKQTQGQVSGNLNQTGHSSAFALLDSSGFRTVQTAGIKNSIFHTAVFLASLHVRMTLVQALSGFSLSLPTPTDSYRGVSIYQESFPSCVKLSSSAPQRIYAALDKGYVVMGFETVPIKRVIDVAEGVAPSLESRPAFHNLAAQVPAGSLAGYYLNGSALQSLKSGRQFQALTGTQPHQASTAASPSSVAGVYADPDGLRMVTATTASPSARNVRPAGQIAAHLPASTVALISLQNVKSTLQSLVHVLGGVPLLGAAPRMANTVLHGVMAHLSGEVDLVQNNPANGLATISQVPLQFSLLWQVNSTSAARQDLTRLAHSLDANDPVHAATAPGGTPYLVDSQGLGYAAQDGWAVMSEQVPAILTQLRTTPYAPLSQVPALRQTTAPGSIPGAIIYVDTHSLRTWLERVLLPRAGSTASTYRTYVLPVLAPIQTFASQNATSADGNYTVGTAFVRIGK